MLPTHISLPYIICRDRWPQSVAYPALPTLCSLPWRLTTRPWLPTANSWERIITWRTWFAITADDKTMHADRKVLSTNDYLPYIICRDRWRQGHACWPQRGGRPASISRTKGFKNRVSKLAAKSGCTKIIEKRPNNAPFLTRPLESHIDRQFYTFWNDIGIDIHYLNCQILISMRTFWTKICYFRVSVKPSFRKHDKNSQRIVFNCVSILWWRAGNEK